MLYLPFNWYTCLWKHFKDNSTNICNNCSIVFKDSNLTQVTYDDLKLVYHDNKDLLSYSDHSVQGNNPFIRSFGELVTPKRTVDDVRGTDLYLQWWVYCSWFIFVLRGEVGHVR